MEFGIRLGKEELTFMIKNDLKKVNSIFVMIFTNYHLLFV